MQARVQVIISGYVQGVFFRSAIRNQARIHHLTGWVRNTPSGRVEALFEGDKDQIKEMIEFCRQGPPGARVGDVQLEWQEYNGGFSDFEIR